MKSFRYIFTFAIVVASFLLLMRIIQIADEQLATTQIILMFPYLIIASTMLWLTQHAHRYARRLGILLFGAFLINAAVLSQSLSALTVLAFAFSSAVGFLSMITYKPKRRIVIHEPVVQPVYVEPYTDPLNTQKTTKPTKKAKRRGRPKKKTA